MAIGYIIGAVPLIVDVADFPAVGDVKNGVTFDNGNKTGSYVVFAGQDLIGTLEESVDLTGELQS